MKQRKEITSLFLCFFSLIPEGRFLNLGENDKIFAFFLLFYTEFNVIYFNHNEIVYQIPINK